MSIRDSGSGFRDGITAAGEIFGQCFDSTKTMARIMVESRSIPRIPRVARGRVLVIGTGPSLKDSLGDLYKIDYSGLSFISVNDYFKEDSFAILKPEFHVIADPIYWDSECFDEYGCPLVESMATAEWNPLLFLPRRAQGSKLHGFMRSRQIKFEFYNATPIKGLRVLEDFAFWRMLGMPKPQNVLVAAIAMALWLDFKSIALIGADHSWHQEIKVTRDNMLIVNQVHSYDKQNEARPFYKPAGVRKISAKLALTRADIFNVKDIFRAWATMHESYERLNSIAARRQASIVNASSLSFIDAFSRVDLADFVSK